jgi:hypothetical protein
MIVADNGSQRTPGFLCPSCGFFIEVSLESLLYASGHMCPGCGTNFDMDREESGSFGDSLLNSGRHRHELSKLSSQ